MHKIISKYGFIAFFIGLLAMVYIQGLTEFIKEPKLGRSLDKVEKPELKLDNWLEGTWQHKIGDYSKRNFGFFNSAFLEYNQIDFSLFNIAHARNVVIGKQLYLYEQGYIDAYYGRDLLTDSVINTKLIKLKYIQRFLDSCNTKLVVLFAPGKASYYPEYIPDYLVGEVPVKTNNSEFEKAFVNNKIDYINLRNWFVNMKDTSSYPLVSQTGIHWSYYGMLLAIDSIINYSEQLLNKDLPNLKIKNIELSNKPRATDGDIEQGMNLFYSVNKQELAYPNFEYEQGAFDTASAILIGDSYGLGLQNRRFLYESFTNGQFWFYFRNNYQGKKPRTNLRYENWIQQIKNTDVVFLISTEATMKKFSYGFIEDAFYILKPNHKLNGFRRLKVDDFKAKIRKNKSAITRLSQKAENNKVSIEKVIELEAQYLYRLKYRNGKSY